jgi:vacuolar-type H+-ATPase subunit F/Vma7
MRCVLIADEITALGWRLTGAQIELPDARTVAECFTVALRDADLLLITAPLAASVPAAQLQDALRSQRPLVLVIADLQLKREPPDVEDEVRRALGVSI